MATPPDLQWFDVQSFGVEGKGWSDVASYFDRLPARAEGKVRPVVWNLSRSAIGMRGPKTPTSEMNSLCCSAPETSTWCTGRPPFSTVDRIRATMPNLISRAATSSASPLLQVEK